MEYCLRPTLVYLRVEKLNMPNKQKVFLLNTIVEKLRVRSIGSKYEEAASFYARMPAIFGYNIDDNLRPNYEFLVEEMERN
ncbi:hypothetical protein CRYUN_Cryun18bG0088600 [Craigia yunnanensis]